MKQKFLLVDGIIAAQTPGIEASFKSILNSIDTIVEIGFNRGALSLWLSRNKKAKTKLVSYDITFQDKCVDAPEIDFRLGDCFEECIIEEIRSLIQRNGKTLLLCDGGNKEKEFEIYASFLKDGDVIMLHDYAHSDSEYEVIKESIGWETPPESRYENIKDLLDLNNLIPYQYEMFKNVLWGSFIKKHLK
jgi:hypothetical protein